jgi:plastocyanin
VGVHAATPSLAPILAAIGTFAIFAGLVIGGPAILVGVVVLVMTLLYWGREGLRDYDHLVHVEPIPAIEQGPPPPGVHMIGPSFRPILASLAVAVLFFGLVFPGWLLLVGLVFTIVTLLGWLRDGRAEYVKAVEADRTGHLEPLPPPTWPKTVLAVFTVLVVAALVVDAGILPPRPTTATGGEPGASPPPSPSGPQADVSIVAEQVKFSTPEVMAPAGRSFTIAFDNRDPQTPHDVDITAEDGTPIFDGEVFPGPKVEIYDVPALDAGSYPFHCSVHPNMTGTLTAQ